jgi:hypothetical protein
MSQHGRDLDVFKALPQNFITVSEENYNNISQASGITLTAE